MSNLGTMKKIDRPDPKVYHLPNWANGDDNARMDVISDIITKYGRDPKIATQCVDILKMYNVAPRDYVGQCGALLKWVQDHIYYVNEPGERLQDPNYTLKVGYGDCDDMAILLCAFFESMRLPWKLVISGRANNGEIIRYIHRNGRLPQADWSHIYCMVCVNPFNEAKWYYCEPTLRNVPLGWDVVSADGASLPELMDPNNGKDNAVNGFGNVRTSALIGSNLAAEVAYIEDKQPKKDIHAIAMKIFEAVAIGVITAWLSSIILDKTNK